MPLLLTALLALTPYFQIWKEEPVEVRVRIPETELSVAEILRVELSVQVPKLGFDEVLEKARDRNYKAQPPADVMARLPSMVLKEIEFDSTQNATSITDTWTFLLEPQLPGELEIPALTITCTPLEEGLPPLQVTTDAIPFTVRSVINDPKTATLREAAPEIEGSGKSWRWLLLLLAVAGWIGYRFGRHRMRRRRADSYHPSKSRLPAHFALDELERTDDPASAHRILRLALRDALELDISAMPEPSLLGSDKLSQDAEIELVEILRELESAIYTKEGQKLSKTLKDRIRIFLQTHLPS